MDKPSKPIRATIVDVANYAGVSTMTVSRVIRNHAKVSESTRKKVNHAINELNYSPNLIARALVGANVKRICILFGSLSSPFLGELMFGALKATNQHEINLLVESIEGELNVERLAKQFRSQWDGVVIAPPLSSLASLRALVKKMNFPAVFLSSAVDYTDTEFNVNEIRIDDYQSAFDMTSLLIKKGHRRIAFIKGNEGVAASVSEKRLQGFIAAMHNAKVPMLTDYVQAGDFTFSAGEQSGLALLSLPSPPTAIFASNDDMAAGVMTAAKHMGVSIPTQLAVAGFDDTAIASIISPALTTVRQPIAEMAHKAISLIISSRDPVITGVKVFEHTIVERQTT